MSDKIQRKGISSLAAVDKAMRVLNLSFLFSYGIFLIVFLPVAICRRAVHALNFLNFYK